MALIQCPECNREISDKANFCPHCGYQAQTTEVGTPEVVEEQMPEELLNYQAGYPVSAYTYSGELSWVQPSDSDLRTGAAELKLHERGLSVICRTKEVRISNKHVISIRVEDDEFLSEESKSVLGRAVVGGLLLGPAAAIVGGLSGLGTKQKVKKCSLLIVQFWNTKTRAKDTLVFSVSQSNRFLLDGFLAAYQAAKKGKEELKLVIAEKKNREFSGCIIILLIIVLIFGAMYTCS